MSTILIIIILINVLFTYKGLNDYGFFRKFEFHIGSIRSGDQYRMITSGFLHADLMHILFNMYTLFIFGGIVLSHLGNVNFLILYFASLIIGNLFTLMFHKEDYNYRAVGASGAVMGILYSSIILQPDMSLYLFFIPIPIPSYIFGLMYLLYSIYGMKAQNDNIGHTAHFGGAIAGYAFTLLNSPQIFYEEPIIVALLAVPIIILFVLIKLKKI